MLILVTRGFVGKSDNQEPREETGLKQRVNNEYGRPGEKEREYRGPRIKSEAQQRKFESNMRRIMEMHGSYRRKARV